MMSEHYLQLSQEEKMMYSRMASLCSRRECSEYDIRLKLEKAGIGQDAADRIVSVLSDEKFLDAGRYCRACIRDRMFLNRWGRRKIENFLVSRHIPESVYGPAFDEVISESGDRASVILTELMSSKMKILSRRYDCSEYGDRIKCKAALVRFGVSRGFPYAEVLDAVNSFFD